MLGSQKTLLLTPDPFNPADLFNPGDVGVFIDIDNYATSVFTTSVGSTTVSGEGDRVGRIEDESGLNAHFIQADTGDRLTFETDTGGSYWVAGNALGDFMISTLSSVITGNDIFFMAAIETPTSINASEGFTSAVDTGASADWSAGAPNAAVLLSRAGGAESYEAARGGSAFGGTAIAAGTKAVWMTSWDGAADQVTTVVDNGTPNTSAYTAVAFDVNEIYMMARYTSSSASNFCSGRVYALMVIDRIPNASEEDDLWTWFGDKLGKSL